MSFSLSRKTIVTPLALFSAILLGGVAFLAPVGNNASANFEIIGVGQKLDQNLMAASTNKIDTQGESIKVDKIPEPEPAPELAVATNSSSGGATGSTGFVPPSVPAPTPGSAQAIAQRYVGDGGEFSCLVVLWNRESNWNTYAHNSSSGAYGIPQSLPGNKMAAAGPDWRTNPETQIRWGLSYIQGRYGSPCAALAHSNQVGWY